MLKPAKPEEIEVDDKPYQYYEQKIIRSVHHYYISSAIEGPELYVDMVHRISTAGPDELIYIHLNTPGGQLDTGVQIVNAMLSTAAHVTVGIEGNCFSLGTLIFLAADEFIVHDNCLMMIHNYSGGVFGKGNEQQSQLEAQIKWFNTLSKKLYVPFLSVAEFEKVMRGEDIWLQSNDIRERLEKMVKVVGKEQKEPKVSKKSKNVEWEKGSL